MKNTRNTRCVFRVFLLIQLIAKDLLFHLQTGWGNGQTALGGLAATPTGQAVKERLRQV